MDGRRTPIPHFGSGELKNSKLPEENITLKQAEYKLKAVKKSAIKTKTQGKTKETPSTGRPNIEYCTVEQLIVAIGVSFI